MERNAAEAEVRELEAELNLEVLPGTEIMRDVGSHHFVKGGSVVLVPQPSSDPHDPLNWSPLWKILCITAASSVSFTQGLGPLSLAPMFPYYIKDFDSNLHDVIKFTAVAILVLAFSNFIWVPLSTAFGRRPVYIFSQIMVLGSAIWRAKATSYNSFMGACILNGIAAGPGETIQPAVITDIFFLHDRGFWNALYFTALLSSLMVGPIISGTMAQHVGWRNFWWFFAALIAASLLMVIFMFPETKYQRSHPHETQHEKPQPLSSDSVKDNNVDIVQSPTSDTASLHNDRPIGAPSRRQWGLFHPSPDPFKAIFSAIWTPWKLFAFPIVEWSSFVVSWSCSVYLTINLTQSQNFAAPPYNFSPQAIGFTNFAVLIGALLGLVTAGPLSDYISARATKKNGGIREPEMRIPTMIPYVLIMILGNFIVAFGYQQKWPWQVIVIVGYTCAGIQVTALPTIVTTYAVDSYKPVASPLLLTITINKNLYGYGFAEFITPWIISDGYVPPIMTNMSLMTLFCLFGVLFYFYGNTFRRMTRHDSVHNA